MDEGFVIIEICQNKSKQLWSNSWPDYSYGHAKLRISYITLRLQLRFLAACIWRLWLLYNLMRKVLIKLKQYFIMKYII